MDGQQCPTAGGTPVDSNDDRAPKSTTNVVLLEHVNVTVPDQRVATLFYVSGLGFTRDPYLMVGVENMWINIGRSQMHLPTNRPQRLRGVIGLVVPDLTRLKERLQRVAPDLEGTRFGFADHGSFVSVTCPWGNRFRCHAPALELGDTMLAMPYVQFDVPAGSAKGIARFYTEILGATAELAAREDAPSACVRAGQNQRLWFRETSDPIPPYDGHHVQIYIADFVGPHRRLLERKLITMHPNEHEWRFRDIVDLDTGRVLFTVEHEVRSLDNPLYARPLVNRNPEQTNRAYLPGRDGFPGTY
jgi:catechol-2,3-dioxygenase